MSLADEVYGPEPGAEPEPKRKSLADQVYGSDPTEQWVEQLPSLVQPGAKRALEHRQKIEQKENLYGARGAGQAVRGPVDVIGKAEELKAQARGPLKEWAVERIEQIERPAKEYLYRTKKPVPLREPSLAEKVYSRKPSPEKMTFATSVGAAARKKLQQPKPQAPSLAEQVYPAIAPEYVSKLQDFAKSAMMMGEKEPKPEPYTIDTWPLSRVPTAEEVQKQGEAMGLTQREIEEYKGRGQMPLEMGREESKQLSDTMLWLENIFGAPLRAGRGLLKDVRDWAKWGAGYLASPEMAGPKPQAFGSSILPSVMKEGKEGEDFYLTGLGLEMLADLKLHLIPEVVRFERESGELKPGEILTENEKLAGTGYFLGAEIFGYGPVLKLLRLGRGLPGPQAVKNQVMTAMKKAGKKISKEDAIGIGRAVMNAKTHPEGVKIFHNAIWKKAKQLGLSDAKAAEAAREGLRIIGAEGRYLGKSGFRIKAPYGKKGALRTQVAEAKRTGRDIPGIPAEVKAKIPAADLPMGADIPPWSLSRIPGVGKAWYEMGSARGTAEALRPGQAYTTRGVEKGERGGKLLSKAMGGKEQEIKHTRLLDLRDNLSVRDKLDMHIFDLRTQFSEVAGAAEKKMLYLEIKVARQNIERADKQLQLAYKRAGLTEAEVRAGFPAENPQQRQAAMLFDRANKEMDTIERANGLEHGERDFYVYRTEDPELKALRKRMKGPTHPSASRAGFMQERQRALPETKEFRELRKMRKEWFDEQKKLARKSMDKDEFRAWMMVHSRDYEKWLRAQRQQFLSTTSAGTRNRTFVEGTGPVHAERTAAHHFAVGAKKNEDAIVHGYGHKLTDDMAAERGLRDVEELASNELFIRELEAKGLKPYWGALGNNKGNIWILNRGTAEMLEKALNPTRFQGFVKHWSRLHNWWKGWATVLRPNFVERNVFFGNVWNAWLADVDLVNAPYLAMKVQFKIAKASPLGEGAVLNTLTGQMAKRADKIFPAKIAGRGVSEQQLAKWAKWGIEDGVPGGGMWGGELGKQKYWFPLMKLNKKLNILGEDNFRWAVYIDSLQKGYSRREAMARVAKICFNYNEQAAFGEVARQIFSFSTWNLKNWGLQLSMMMNKPDKLSKFVRGWTGIQAIDPLDPMEAEAMGLDYIQDWIPFFVPVARGAEGGRMRIAGKGLFPILNLVDVLDPEQAAQTGAEMVNPLLRFVAEKVAGLVQQGRPERFSVHPRDPTTRYALVPNWVHGLMEVTKSIDPHLQQFFMYALDIKPVRDRYKWTKDMEEYVGLHPGLGTLGRLTRAKEEQVIDAMLNLITPLRVTEITPQRLNMALQERWNISLKDLEEFELHMKQLDIMLDPFNPLRHEYE